MTVLIVEDKGVGIKEDVLDNLFNNKENKDSIGLINVNSRLKNKYGESYGLEINSQYNEGTTVMMKIPKIMELNKEDNKGHRSYLVNLNFIESIIPWYNAIYALKLTGVKENIPVSRSKINEFKNIMNL